MALEMFVKLTNAQFLGQRLVNRFYESGSISLLFQEINQLNISIFSKVSLETFLCPHLKVLNIANVDIPSRTSMDG